MTVFYGDALLDKADIGISVHKGIVSLIGQVDAYSKKLTAQQVVWRVKEVRAGTLDIKISLPSERALTDTVIAEKVIEALRIYNPASPGELG